MSAERRIRTLDVSGLPSVTFGPKSLLWWGTMGFIVIEGFTIVLMVASYFYLRQSEYQWPPGRTPLPDLLIPTINLVLLLLVIIPMHRVDEAAKRYDRQGVARGFVIATLMTAPTVVLRWFELTALNVRWDAHAYGSAAWAVVVLHGALLLTDFVETGLMAALFLLGHAQRKHFSDASDAALYQYFLSLSWIPLYLVIYWGPRVL